MTLRSGDLIWLPYDPGLTLAGVTYVCRSLGRAVARISRRPSPARLRREVAAVAGEMALRHWMDAQGVPYALFRSAPFTDPLRYSLLVGGRQLRVLADVCFEPPDRGPVKKDARWLLSAEVRLTPGPLGWRGQSSSSLLAVVFVLAEVAARRSQFERASAEGRRVDLLAIPPGTFWHRPRRWRLLAPVSLSSEAPCPLELEIAGQRRDRAPHLEWVTLEPHAKSVLEGALYTLRYLRASQPPGSALEVRSGATGRRWRVLPGDWFNLWIYGRAVVLAGWTTQAALRRWAPNDGYPLREGAPGSQGALTLPLKELRPMQDLVSRLC